MAHTGYPPGGCPPGGCPLRGHPRCEYPGSTERGDVMGSVVKKRRKKIAKHKYKKLRKRMRHQRRKK
jgi:hypothetical protein